MGLCKCPKRQVTTQFCFEHRVNVCENCMVVNHTKCTVQSYIQWLKDSDFDSNCTLCGSPRGSDDCVRLICYHVFHWKCLNARQQLLPPNTAPGGHTCPICNDPIFPSGNLVSPVADVLRVRLGQVNWGRNELGLPLLLDERGDHSKNFTVASTNPVAATPGLGVEVISAPNGATAYGGVHGSLAQIRAAGTSNAALLSGKERPDSPHSIVNLEQYANVANSRRTTLLSREPPIGGSDRDDNKYKRRTPQEIFSRWSRRLYTPSARPVWRKNWLLVVMGLIAIVCIVYIMAEVMTADRSGSDQHGFIPNRNLPHAEE